MLKIQSVAFLTDFHKHSDYLQGGERRVLPAVGGAWEDGKVLRCRLSALAMCHPASPFLVSGGDGEQWSLLLPLLT